MTMKSYSRLTTTTCPADGSDDTAATGIAGQPPATYSVVPAWYGGTTWDKQGPKPLQWGQQLSGHNGVWGLIDGNAGEASVSVQVSNLYRPDYVKQVWYQFDVYQGGGASCVTELVPDGSGIYDWQQTTEDIQFGWQRVTTTFKVKPQPQCEKVNWAFTTTDQNRIAIDNVYIGAYCSKVPEPSSLAALGCPILALLVGFRRRG